MTDTQTAPETIATAAVQGFRGPRIRRRIEARPDSAFAGFWFDVNEATWTNGDVEALRRNTYWVDILATIAPHVIGWNYLEETVEAVEEPAVYAEDGTTERAPARTVWRVVGEAPIPPPAEGGVASLERVWRIETGRGVRPDETTVAWMADRMRGYRDDLAADALKALRLLAAGGTGPGAATQPPAPEPPSPTSPPSSTPATSPRRSRSTSRGSAPPSG